MEALSQVAISAGIARRVVRIERARSAVEKRQLVGRDLKTLDEVDATLERCAQWLERLAEGRRF